MRWSVSSEGDAKVEREGEHRGKWVERAFRFRGTIERQERVGAAVHMVGDREISVEESDDGNKVKFQAKPSGKRPVPHHALRIAP